VARIRYIKPEYFLDEELADLGMQARLLFIGLWTIADRDGRLEDRPRKIKAQIFPYDAVDVDNILNELSPKFIVRYKIAEHCYIQIRNFKKHQRPHTKEADSVIPTCPKEQFAQATKLHGKPEKNGASTLIMGTGTGMGMGMGMGTEVVKPDNNGASPEKKRQINSDAKYIAERLSVLILENDPKARVPKDLTRWGVEAERLLQRDKREKSEIIAVMEWALKDSFWKSNILSIPKLRSQFTTLKLRMEESYGTKGPTRSTFSKPKPGKYSDVT